MANVLKRQGKLDDVAVGRGRGGGRAGSLLAAIAARDQAGGRAGRGGLVVC
jgi:hypothetical protein